MFEKNRNHGIDEEKRRIAENYRLNDARPNLDEDFSVLLGELDEQPKDTISIDLLGYKDDQAQKRAQGHLRKRGRGILDRLRK